MDMTGISALDPAMNGAASEKRELDKNAFLSLLVEQIKAQDPINPTKNDEFIAQLANFSSLEQMQTLNENIVGMVLLQQGNALMSQLTESSELIGKTVKYVDPATEAVSTGVVTSVKIEDGLAQLNVDGKSVPLGNVTEVVGAVEEPPADAEDDPEADAEADESGEA